MLHKYIKIRKENQALLTTILKYLPLKQAENQKVKSDNFKRDRQRQAACVRITKSFKLKVNYGIQIKCD
jgi:hypothetical protein